MIGAAGFTLVELVTTLIIIGILSALTLPRMFDNQAFGQRGYIDEIAFALRYAQKIAVASECPVEVTIGVATYSALQRARDPVANTCDPAGVWNVPVLRADGSPLNGTAPSNVLSAPATVVTFDATGALIGGAPPQLTVGAFTLNVTAATGMVTVLP